MFCFSEVEGISISFEPCPFCGGTPEWVLVPGDDFIMRCSRCHASTRKAEMEPEAAAQDWNRGEICDDHFSILSDKMIDEYLHSIKKVLFSGYWYDEFPSFDEGFLCSDAVIETDDMILEIGIVGEHLVYDTLGGYSSDMYCRSIADTNVEISFKSSSWCGCFLTSITFQCGDTTAVVSADKENQCMVVTFK